MSRKPRCRPSLMSASQWGVWPLVQRSVRRVRYRLNPLEREYLYTMTSTLERLDHCWRVGNTSWTKEEGFFHVTSGNGSTLLTTHACYQSMPTVGIAPHCINQAVPSAARLIRKLYKLNQFFPSSPSKTPAATTSIFHNLMSQSSSNFEQFDTPLNWCCTDHTPTSTMAHSVTQTSNTISPEIAARPGMATVLATVDPEIDAIQLNFTYQQASLPDEDVPSCVSQFPLAANLSTLPAEIVIGLLKEIPRWVRGSVINFAAYSEGYPKPEDAVYAAQQLNRAALFWNSKRVGVTFKWVRSNGNQPQTGISQQSLINLPGQKSRRRRLRPRLRHRRQPRPNRPRVLPQRHRPQRHASLPDRIPRESPPTPVAVLPARAGARVGPAARVCARRRGEWFPIRASRSAVGDELPQRAADDYAERCGLHDCAVPDSGREDWDDSLKVVRSG